MSRDIRESDWKLLKKIHEAALDRFCKRVLDDAAEIILRGKRSNYERYGSLYELMRERDKELAGMFDDMKRSNAVFQLLAMRHAGLVTDEEMGGLSPELQDQVQSFLAR